MTHPSHDVRPQDLADETIELVQRWLRDAAYEPVEPAAQQLAGVLQDPNGLDFTCLLYTSPSPRDS